MLSLSSLMGTATLMAASNEAQAAVEWAEHFQKNYRLMTDQEKQEARLRLEKLPEPLDGLLGHGAREEALLAGVAAEDVGEARRDHGREAEVAQRPHGVLAAGARAEVGARDEDLGALVGGLVEDEVGVLTPRVEQGVIEARLGDALEELGRDDLVGVDVVTHHIHRAGKYRLHGGMLALLKRLCNQIPPY